MPQPSLVDRAVQRRADEQAGPDVAGAQFSYRRHLRASTPRCAKCGRGLNKNNRRRLCTQCQRRG